MIEVVQDTDGTIAAWGFETQRSTPMLYNLALGVKEDGQIKGAILFTGVNGSEAEVHYYGPGTLKRNVLVTIFKVALLYLNLNRLTVRTRKPSMARGVKKLGAVYEGTFKRVYGPTDGAEHAARQYAFFRERMAEIAGITEMR